MDSILIQENISSLSVYVITYSSWLVGSKTRHYCENYEDLTNGVVLIIFEMSFLVSVYKESGDQVPRHSVWLCSHNTHIQKFVETH